MTECPRCHRTSHVRGGYFAARGVDVFACWWCCHEWAPGTVFGISPVAPTTSGTLRGFAEGGVIREPTVLLPVDGSGCGWRVTMQPSGVDAVRDEAWWNAVASRELGDD